MKKLVIALGLFGSLHAFAGTPSAEIYSSLNATEINIGKQGMDISTYEKTLGGLTCKKTINFMPRPTRNGNMRESVPTVMCTLQLDGRNDKAIYEALMVQEQRRQPGAGGGVVGIKEVGTLKCELSEFVNAGNVIVKKASCLVMPAIMHYR